MTIWTLRAAILIALFGAGTLGLAVVTRPATSHAAPLAQATATPTLTPTPTSTPRVASGWTREDQPDGTRCYIYESGFGRPVSCVTPP